MATAIATEKKGATGARTHNVGRVVQVIGPVLDVAFETDHLPELYNALQITGTAPDGGAIDVVAEVQQHIGRNQVRAVAMSNSSGVVMHGPIELAKSLPRPGPRLTSISRNWMSRALQSLKIV